MTTAGPLEIRTFTAAGFGENAYLVRCGAGDAAVAIDPGGEAEAMAAAVRADTLRLEAILLTHAHLDHIEGVASLARRTDAPIYLHAADEPLYRGVMQQAAMFGLRVEPPPPADRRLEHGEALRFGDCAFEVRHAPGHSPGHVLFYCAEAAVAFVGDVVFMGSIGRTDLPGGDFQQLMASIREQVLTLPEETALFSGHGPPSSVRHEARSNPFLIPHYGGSSFA